MLLQIEMVISSFFIAVAVGLVQPLTINTCNCFQTIVKGTIDLEYPEYCSHPEPIEAPRKMNYRLLTKTKELITWEIFDMCVHSGYRRKKSRRIS